MRHKVAAATMLAFLMAVLWPYTSRADNPPPAQPGLGDEALTQAKQHFEAGRNAYNAGDYVTAIREFKAAEALRPSAILAYNIGLANEKLGKKRVALKYYKRYLEQMPNAANRAEVDGRIAQLEQELAAQPPPPPVQPGQPGTEQPSDMPPAQAGQPTSSYDPYAPPASQPGQPATPAKKKSYWWVWLLVGGGAALVVAIIVVVAVLYVDTSTVYYEDRAMLTSPRDPAMSTGRTPSTLLPLFHF